MNPATTVESTAAATLDGRGAAALRWAHRTFWAALFVLTPLLFHPTMIFRGLLPPDQVASLAASSTLAARSFGLFALLVYGTVLLLAGSPYRLSDLGRLVRRWPATHLILLAVVALVLLSTPFSNLSPDFVLIGSENRFDGTLIVAGYLLLALVAAGLARSRVLEAPSVLRLFVAGGLVASIFVLMQAAGIEPLNLLPGPRVSLGHPEGPFGHGGRTSTYLAMALLVTIAGPLRSGRLRWWHLSIGATLAAGIVAAGGRAAVLALVVVWLLLGALLLLRGGGRSIRPYLAVTLLAAALGSGLLFATPWGRTMVDRTVAAFTSGDASLQHRLIFWRAGRDLIAEHPLWGVGPSGFAFGIYDHVTERERAELLSEFLGFVPEPGRYTIEGEAVVYAVPGTDDVTFQRVRMSKAHSYLLDFALSHGLPAAILLAVFAALATVQLLRSESEFAFGVGLAFAVFVLFGLFWFASVSLDPLVWGLVGAGLGFAGATRIGADATPSPTAQ